MKKLFASMIFGTWLVGSSCAFAINPPLSTKDFATVGAGTMIAKISSVNLTYQSSIYEAGTVVLTPTQIISGQATAEAVELAFTRAIAVTESPSNWDLIGLSGTSLSAQIGLQLLVFYTESNNALALYPASNAVQNLSTGVFLGKVRSTSDYDRKKSKNEISFDVSEAVFGWISGTTVTLSISNSRGGGDHHGTSWESGKNVNRVSVRDYCNGGHDGDSVLVYYADGKIESIAKVDESLLQSIDELNSD